MAGKGGVSVVGMLVSVDEAGSASRGVGYAGCGYQHRATQVPGEEALRDLTPAREDAQSS